MKRIIIKLLRFMKIKYYQLMLKDKKWSIISNDCCGGCMYHDMGLRFLSPTINLFLKPEDFIKYIKNIKEYNKQEIYELNDNDKNYPIGICGGGPEKLEDIQIHFMHYSSFEEAKNKWDQRKSRINYNKCFYLFHLNEDNVDIAQKFLNLDNKKNRLLIMYKNQKSSFDISGFQKKNVHIMKSLDAFIPGEILKKNRFQIRYLEEINYIKLLNRIK